MERICQKGDEPIPPGSVGPKDGIKALKYILYCWNEEVLVNLQPIAIPQHALEKARQWIEKTRDRFELKGRVLHVWGGKNIATSSADLAKTFADNSKTTFRMGQSLIRISDPKTDPTTAARIRKEKDFEGAPGGPNDPALLAGKRLAPILPSDQDTMRALIAEVIATKKKINVGTRGKPITQQMISSYAFKQGADPYIEPDRAILGDLIKRLLPEYLPELKAIISAPTMPCLPHSTRPEDLCRDGVDRILSKPGYDSATGLFLAPLGNIVQVPDVPTPDQVNIATKRLLIPWQDFSFVSPAPAFDAKVSHSAVVFTEMTALDRSALPLAPALGLTSKPRGTSNCRRRLRRTTQSTVRNTFRRYRIHLHR